MKDRDCIDFLQRTLPKLGRRWQGYRKVRGQVCKRIDRRMRDLGLPDIGAYEAFLKDDAAECNILDSLCSITISRFYRDREVFEFLEREVLPTLALTALSRGDKELRCWSIGCASGEEPYTLVLEWDSSVKLRFPSLTISVLATDTDRNMIERAEQGCYSRGSLKELRREWIEQEFVQRGSECCLRPEKRSSVIFFNQDIRLQEPDGFFHLIFCRNLVFTYFDQLLQEKILARLRKKLLPGGALVIGIHEALPAGHPEFISWPGGPRIYHYVPEKPEPGR